MKNNELDPEIGDEQEQPQNYKLHDQFDPPFENRRQAVDKKLHPDMHAPVEGDRSADEPHPNAKISGHLIRPGKGIAEHVPEKDRHQNHQNKDGQKDHGDPRHALIKNAGKAAKFFHDAFFGMAGMEPMLLWDFPQVWFQRLRLPASPPGSYFVKLFDNISIRGRQ